jgi:hypothetical protein
MLSLTTKFNTSTYFKFKAFSLLIALFLNFFLIGCGSGGSSNNDNSNTPPATNAQTPTIITQPQSAAYAQYEIATLNVTATVNDGGTLSYQWYSNTINSNQHGILIPGAIQKTYTLPTSSEGVIYYYVVVTNTNNGVYGNSIASNTSDAAEITVNAYSPPPPATTHLVSFYDKNLDFMETISVPEGIFNPTGTWYKANEASELRNYNLNKNITLYAVPNVQEIRNQNELSAARNNLNGYYILLNDITLTSSTLGNDNGEGWLPIGNRTNYFTGIFNGNGNKITGLWINRPNTSCIGLFGFIYQAQIRNLGIEIAKNKEIKGDEQIGGIAGGAYYGNITNSYLIGNVSGDESSRYIGGIVGIFERGFITNSYSNVTVGGYGWIGGIAGTVIRGSIANSYSNGIVSGYQNVGGIAGLIDQNGFIINSYSSANVSSDSIRVGGIVGFASYATIQNNAAINPSVTGKHNAAINRVIGHIDNSVTASNNFALSNMGSGFTNSGNKTYHGTSKTVNELKQKATYSNAVNGDGNGGLGWKFGNDNESPWKINEGKGYPYLYWQK